MSSDRGVFLMPKYTEIFKPHDRLLANKKDVFYF